MFFHMACIPLSQAAFNTSNPSSSSMTHFAHSLLPMPMVPRIGEETRSPEEPSWTYSTLVPFRLLCSEAGRGGADILLVAERKSNSARVFGLYLHATRSLYIGRAVSAFDSDLTQLTDFCRTQWTRFFLPPDRKRLANMLISRVSPDMAR